MRQRVMSRGRLGWTGMALGAAVGATAYYMWRSQLAERRGASDQSGPDPYLTESITVNQPIEQVYAAWRDLESIGFVRGAQITDAREQESCAWTLPSGARGEVFFQRAPGARGTEVHVQLETPAAPFPAVGDSRIRHGARSAGSRRSPPVQAVARDR